MYAAAPGASYVDGSGPFAPVESALSDSAIAQAWIHAGGDPGVADEAIAIVRAESGGVPNAVNPTDNNGTQTSWGLFQLSDGTHNAPGVNWADPVQNAAGAVSKYQRAGNSWARDWGTYGGSAYEQYLNEIRSGGNSDPYSATSSAGDGGDNSDNLLEKGINAITGGAYDRAKGALSTSQNIMLIPEHILQNFGPFIIAIMLLLIGGIMMTFSWGERLVDAVESDVGTQIKRLTSGKGGAAGGAAGAAEGEEAAAVVAV